MGKRMSLLSAVMITSVAGWVSIAAASPITTPGLTITVGDKVFSDFTCSPAIPIGTTGPTSCAQISVVGNTSPTGLFGIEIGAFFNALSSGTTSTGDFVISYDVTSTDGLISDIHMSSNPTLTGSGLLVGLAQVTETVFDLDDGGGTLAQISVQSPPLVASASANLTVGGLGLVAEPEDAIHVVKDVGVTASCTPVPPSLTCSANATISFIDQNFSQIPVPEPTSLALFGTALVGLGFIRRRRKNVA